MDLCGGVSGRIHVRDDRWEEDPMNPSEEGVLRCEGYRKDSWATWTSLVWLGITAQVSFAAAAIVQTIEGSCWGSIFLSLLSLLGVWFAIEMDKTRSCFQKEWSRRIEAWKAFPCDEQL